MCAQDYHPPAPPPIQEQEGRGGGGGEEEGGRFALGVPHRRSPFDCPAAETNAETNARSCLDSRRSAGCARRFQDHDMEDISPPARDHGRRLFEEEVDEVLEEEEEGEEEGESAPGQSPLLSLRVVEMSTPLLLECLSSDSCDDDDDDNNDGAFGFEGCDRSAQDVVDMTTTCWPLSSRAYCAGGGRRSGSGSARRRGRPLAPAPLQLPQQQASDYLWPYRACGRDNVVVRSTATTTTSSSSLLSSSRGSRACIPAPLPPPSPVPSMGSDGSVSWFDMDELMRSTEYAGVKSAPRSSHAGPQSNPVAL